MIFKFFKVLNRLVITLCLMLTFVSSSVRAMLDFEEGQEFRRTQAESPLLLKFSAAVNVDNYDLSLKRSGFNIYSYDAVPKNRKHLGYITFTLEESRKVVEISWVKIKDSEQRKGYGTEALTTLMGILKKRHQAFFPWASHYFITVGNSVGPGMKKTALKSGFKVSSRFWHPETMTDFEKLIFN